jgi:predicted DsbA family dithiol-disulfide isomerase
VRRYGDHFNERVFGMIEAAGLPVTRAIEHVPNGRNALLVAQLARERGRLPALLRPIFEAYWAHGRDIGDPDVLVECAAAAGLPEDEVRAAIAGEEGLDEVDRLTSEAYELGASGVPAWVIDERIAVPGAQPHEVFERILGKLGHEPVAGGA